MTDFDVFWQRYPRRIGRIAAQKAYVKARKTATADDIIAGVDRYIAHKPQYADYCHPTTWLNQGRWMDEYTAPVNIHVGAYDPFRCPHTPPCEGRWRCHQRTEMDAMRKELRSA